MSATASLRTGNKTIELPVVVGTEDEHAIDISSLRADGIHHNRRGGTATPAHATVPSPAAVGGDAREDRRVEDLGKGLRRPG
jgi:hypothetical protein